MLFLYILGFIWALPLTLFGCLLGAVLYVPRDIKWHDGVLLVHVKWLIGFKDTVGQTFGVVILVKWPIDKVLNTETGMYLLKHEKTHTRQGLYLGILFVPAYLVACLVALLSCGHFYKDNWFEKQARAAEEK